MNVLSLFDGMSCGQLALQRAGIPVDNYFASEIDKHAIKVTMKNFPNTIQLGTVVNWREWNLPHIDLLIAGSPCQGFSKSGKGLNFDDARSKLFFEFIEIRKALRPEFWLLENVDMQKEWRDIISEFMGIQPVKINSALVSAQNRVRLYWANRNIRKPKDRHIYLKDIIEDVMDEKYMGGYNPAYKSQSNSLHDLDGKANVLTAGTHGYALGYILTGKRLEDFTRTFDYRNEKGWSKLNPKKAITLTARMYASWCGNYVSMFQLPHGNNKGGERALLGKTPSLTNSSWEHNNFLKDGEVVRQLTPVECERLQTVPDGYTAGVSDTQRYKMLGNGWTVDAIVEILLQMQSTEPIWHKAVQAGLFASLSA